MGRREIFHSFSLLVEIEGYFTHEFVSYVYETEDSSNLVGENKINYFEIVLQMNLWWQSFCSHHISTVEILLLVLWAEITR
jgi:hypothetical protein